MLRKNARERKEYIFRKSLEQADKKKFESQIKLKEAIEEGKSIPTELKQISSKLLEDIDLIDTSADLTSLMDSEYSLAGFSDPKVMITTSRSPSSRLMQFVKELNLIIPNSFRINRGAYVLKDFGDLCRSNGATDLIIVHEHRGEPDSIIVSHFPHGPTAYFALSDVVLRHDLPIKLSTISQNKPHLIFHNFSSKVGKRVSDILKHIFPKLTNKSQRIISFININDHIVFRHHVWEDNHEEQFEKVQLKEVGPRFKLRLYKIELGTVDMKNLSTEWVHRPFFNKKKPSL